MIEGLRKAVEASPENVPLRKHFAALLLEQSRFEEAEKEYRELLALAPNDDQIQFQVAKAYYGQEKWMVASVVLEQLRRTSNPSADVFLLAANTYLKTNHLPQPPRPNLRPTQ